MKKLFKILGFTLLGIVALMILLPLFFTDKVLKVATTMAEDYLDAKVEVNDLNLNLFKSFPHLNVKIKDVSVVGVKEFEGDTLAAFDQLEATVNIRTLFGGKIKVKSVVLDNPLVNVIVTQSGKPNYDIVKTDSTEVDEEEEIDTTQTKFELALKKFEINNLKVNYTDSVTDVHALIDSLFFKLHGDLSDSRTDLSMLMDIAKLNVRMGPIIYINDAHVNLKSDLDADMQAMKFTFKENLYQINKLGLSLDGWIAMPDTNIRMDLKFGAQNTDFLSVMSLIPAEYAKDLEGVKTSGTFKFDGFAKGDFNAVSFPAFGVDFQIDNARFQYPDLPKSVEDINVKTQVSCQGNLDEIKIDVEKLHLNFAENPIDANLLVQTYAKDMDLAGNINASLDLNAVTQVVPIEDMPLSGLVKAILSFNGKLSAIDNEQYDKFNAKGDITLTNFKTTLEDLPPVEIHKAHLVVSPQYANLDNFNMNLGKSDFSLDGKINNIFQYVFADSTLKAAFNYKSNLIDVNDIFSYDHSQPTETQTVSSSDETTTEAPEIPKNIDFDLNANIGKILYDSLVINNLTGKIGLKNGVALLNNLKMSMLGGNVFANGKYDAADINCPKVDMQLDLSNVDIQQTATTFNTVEKLAPIAKNCHGDLTAKVNFKSNMDKYLNPDLKTVNGDGRLVTKSIGIKDSKIFNLIGEATQNSKLKNPTMKNLNVGFKIVDGNVNVDTTAFKLNDSDGDFYGKLGLDQSLDFNVGMSLANTVANNLLGKVAGSEKSGNIKVNAKIGGTVENPKIVGFNTSATDILKDLANEKIAEVKEKVSEEAQKYIAQAKAQADKLIAEAKTQRDKLVKEAQTQADKLKAEAQSASDKILEEASAQADKLINQAKDPVAKALAKKAVEEAKKKAKTEADKKISQASSKADELVNTAKKQGDKLVSEAETKANKINNDAVAKAKSL